MELFVFNDIERDETVRAILEKDNLPLLRGIVRFAETEGVTDDSIKEYVAAKLANDDNVLSALVKAGKKIGSDLYRLAMLDIDVIYKRLFSKAAIKYTPSGNDTGFYEGYISSIKTITASKNAEELLGGIIEHYRTLGCGLLAKYIAFRFDGTDLTGIPDSDKATFDELVGMEHQKKVLIDNTQAFVEGKFANNVLLFGDRGTGKSTSVKALLNMFAPQGLRVVELPKSAITKIPELTKELEASPHKYILFLDDLTFEKHETEYRALKIAMEGQLQANAGNVLVYATSNRRHLIRETWADRQGDEVHVNDNKQEMLSLSERFGISLFFPSPDAKEYKNIVRVLLERKGIEMTAEIEKEAVRWQMRYGGKSGRCAKQFVADFMHRQ
ncbi:MAG: ATP-binding protein [Candidatus Ornithomonoglobus sp.]